MLASPVSDTGVFANTGGDVNSPATPAATVVNGDVSDEANMFKVLGSACLFPQVTGTVKIVF